MRWKLQVLESVVPIRDDEVVLGQYEGYRDDPTVPDDSNTPTFATAILRIHNERWEGMIIMFRAYPSWRSGPSTSFCAWQFWKWSCSYSFYSGYEAMIQPTLDLTLTRRHW
jgi:hypothetical protein